MMLTTACVSVSNPEEAVRAKAWHQVLSTTDATDYGNDRLRIVANTPLTSAPDGLEMALLTRAAGEARDRGADRFAIVFIDYDSASVADLLLPDFDQPARAWIGTYEDLLAAKAQTDLTGGLDGRFGLKSATAVVRLLDAEEEAHRRAFGTEDTYEALITSRIERRGITPGRQLWFRD